MKRGVRRFMPPLHTDQMPEPSDEGAAVAVGGEHDLDVRWRTYRTSEISTRNGTPALAGVSPGNVPWQDCSCRRRASLRPKSPGA